MENEQQLVICGGCNAKIGPGSLSGLLQELPTSDSSRLLVGFDASDDAAVIKLTETQALIQTVDFFPAMVSDPYLFGKIAAANALSDVYAMGGTVLSALNIVAFPENQDLAILQEILRGGAEKVQEAGGILAGGHSIHDHSAKYGLAVSGLVHPAEMYLNNTGRVGDQLILTKPLGVGIITTGYSVGEVSEAAFQEAVASMELLNKYALEIARKYPVNSCTDVTGFGLLGHLHEMLNGRHSARIDSSRLPYIRAAYAAAEAFILTAGAQRNRNYLSPFVTFAKDDFAMAELLFDPQTSGGLLLSVAPKYAQELVAELNKRLPFSTAVFGEIVEKQAAEIVVE